ncbi:MAG: ATP-dependent DNA helicase RecG [Anaerolineales bacterium]|nr:ATP-dependent DNA helicase RecG [Anaerolineales bacterium]
MNPTIERLLKFFTLEIERDFDNRAVLGGLDQMLGPWEKDASTSGINDELIEVVTSRLRDYPKLSALSREEVLQGVWNRIRASYPETPPFPGTEKRPGVKKIEASPPKEQASSQELQDGIEAGEEAEQEFKLGFEQQKEPAAGAAVTKASAPPSNPIALSASLTTLSGVGPKTAKTLEKLDLFTLGDMLYHFPRRYDDYSQLKPINRLWFGEEVTVIGIVDTISVRSIRNGKVKLIEASISDGTGSLKVTWFNQIWIPNRVQPGRGVVLSGKIDQYLGKLVMNNPEWELLEQKNLHTNRIVPVYPLTSGITGKWLRRTVHTVATHLAPRVLDPVPSSVLDSADLIPLNVALQQIHFPDSAEMLKEAQHRLAFDEMFFLQLGVLQQKSAWEQLETIPIPVPEEWADHFISQLPYTLTNAQSAALQDVLQDLASSKPMNRLLQGDVGSGKTTIAAAAIAITAASGAQAAFMAPTSILAEQHYKTLQKTLPQTGIESDSIKVLTGATPESERREIHEGLTNGSVRVLIGTHALIEAPVTFQQLSLVVIDEQHRFGVHQRALLRSKGNNPNLLVMTATPIPRSLSLTIYGDLDLSIIDEMPPGRQEIETRVLSPRESGRAYNFISGQVELGHQAFIIYPLVEESEKMVSKAAVDQFETLRDKIFPSLELGLLHGRMKPDEKESVMRKFREGEYHILVSTSVIEVGVDIPNATVMVIEGANHFGLSQLHQFRGRVGRGNAKSYCLLIPDSEDDVSNERLKALESTNDGFELAELDLKQRGPGDFLGTRQSGFAELLLADITDIHLIEKARRQARGIFEQDPDLKQPEHKLLAEKVQQLWSNGRGEIS